MRTYIKTISLIAIGVCLGMVIWFGVLGRTTRASQKPPKPGVLAKLPPIKNCTEHIKLIKAELVYQGESQVAALEVENDAHVGVISISIEQIANRARHSTVESGFTPDQPPLVVIPAGGTRTIVLGNLGKAPIRIGGVMFADGEEEGCDSSLKSMRELRDFHMKKGGPEK